MCNYFYIFPLHIVSLQFMRTMQAYIELLVPYTKKFVRFFVSDLMFSFIFVYLKIYISLMLYLINSLEYKNVAIFIL